MTPVPYFYGTIAPLPTANYEIAAYIQVELHQQRHLVANWLTNAKRAVELWRRELTQSILTTRSVGVSNETRIKISHISG
jgi:hypothetical protein